MSTAATGLSPHTKLCDLIDKAWEMTPPFWPLDRMIAINPLSGLDHLPFEKALEIGTYLFREKTLPQALEQSNRVCLKWLPLYFDQGQASITLPGRDQGLFICLRQALILDHQLTRNQRKKIGHLARDPLALIEQSIQSLKAPDQLLFLQLLLTSLPGWASHVHYLRSCLDRKLQSNAQLGTLPTEYLALRLLLFHILGGDQHSLLAWYKQLPTNSNHDRWIKPLKQIEANEKELKKDLLEKLRDQARKKLSASSTTALDLPTTQLIFCMDVRSEPFISRLEKLGPYQIFSMPGFFGAALKIIPAKQQESYPSCPVLVTPTYCIEEKYHNLKTTKWKRHRLTLWSHRLFYSLKHTFSAPFALVETLGLSLGIWMAIRTFFPKQASILRKKLLEQTSPSEQVLPDVETLPLKVRCDIASDSLRSINLTKNFAPLVIICGHEGQSENNAFASALNCGACGGQKGAPNARILASILNQAEVRKQLLQSGIEIPPKTQFLAAAHNTTTDAVELFTHLLPDQPSLLEPLKRIQKDLEYARQDNFNWRMQWLQNSDSLSDKLDFERWRSEDWAQVRPEWGLAKNHAIIIAPREFSKAVDLEGRAFLLSYSYEDDHQQSILRSIFAAPLLVAHAINCQYLFSTLDSSAFGAGSKVTTNVIGKFAVMQGNSSDLMHGLPLQSVAKDDATAHHEMARLTAVIRAPKQFCHEVIEQSDQLKKLLLNRWIFLICYDPTQRTFFEIDSYLQWHPV